MIPHNVAFEHVPFHEMQVVVVDAVAAYENDLYAGRAGRRVAVAKRGLGLERLAERRVGVQPVRERVHARDGGGQLDVERVRLHKLLALARAHGRHPNHLDLGVVDQVAALVAEPDQQVRDAVALRDTDRRREDDVGVGMLKFGHDDGEAEDVEHNPCDVLQRADDERDAAVRVDPPPAHRDDVFEREHGAREEPALDADALAVEVVGDHEADEREREEHEAVARSDREREPAPAALEQVEVEPLPQPRARRARVLPRARAHERAP